MTIRETSEQNSWFMSFIEELAQNQAGRIYRIDGVDYLVNIKNSSGGNHELVVYRLDGQEGEILFYSINTDENGIPLEENDSNVLQKFEAFASAESRPNSILNCVVALTRPRIAPVLKDMANMIPERLRGMVKRVRGVIGDLKAFM